MRVRDITHKVCKKCGLDKTTEHYSFDKTNQRYESLCKPCKSQKSADYIREHRDEFNAYMRERYWRLKAEKNAITTND